MTTKHLVDLALANAMLNTFETMYNQFCEEIENCESCPIGQYCFIKTEVTIATKEIATKEIANKYWRAKESEVES